MPPQVPDGKQKETVMDNAGREPGEQAALWNGIAGHNWVEARSLLDRMLKPLEDLLVDKGLAGSACRVLDVGCGTGGTTLAAARRLGAKGRCIGIDISEPMIAAARADGEREGTPATFICADAESHAFEPESFDSIISRFGVMFFDDVVGAFANLRRAARDDAPLRFIAWRTPEENPFMTTAERAAAPLLPDLPARRPDAPGQFALADAERVNRILEASGWADIDIRPVDVACTLPEPDLTRYLTRLGPVGRALHEIDAQTRARVAETVRAAFDPFVHGAEVRFTAACWMVGARARSGPRMPEATDYLVCAVLTGTGATAVIDVRGLDWARDPTIAPALIVGMATVAAPLPLMQPGMDAGVAASRTPPWRGCTASSRMRCSALASSPPAGRSTSSTYSETDGYR